MRRDQLILLLQPYKNGLMTKKKLAEAVNGFAGRLLKLCEEYPRLRFNVAMPGYMLESIDPLTAGALREMTKRGSVEWLCMGYTEPFLSFSPLWLTRENIALGTKVFTELTGEAPAGYVPPFSNWEPSHIDMFSGAGLKYAVVSSVLLAKNEADSPGYWITEYTGSSMAVFPARSYHTSNAPQSITEWAKESFPADKPDSAPRMLILKYLYPLEAEEKTESGKEERKTRQDKEPPAKDTNRDPQEWVRQTAAEIDKHILEFQPLRFKDAFGGIPPLGLHYFPPSLVLSNNEPASPYFLNHLHCYDQIGVMQRKMMDVCDNVRELKESKQAAALRRQLFFTQDINRLLPSERAGFCEITDRLWTYGKLIDIERELFELRDTQNGVIRLSDFMRNMYKSIIMANRAVKLYLDHKNGAQIYALDYRERAFNVCAVYNPLVRPRPNVIVPRESRLLFGDRIFTEPVTCETYMKGAVKDCSNFSDSPFEYIFKNSPTGIKAILNCNGGFTDGGRHCPLSMDKVFSLEKDTAALSYSYKLGNTTLTDYAFTFGIELPLALSGCASGGARVESGKFKSAIGSSPITIENTAEWEIEDDEAGVRMEFVTQKKVNVWIFPPDTPDASNGVILLITCPMEIETNSTFSLPGMIRFKKIRARSAHGDSL